MENYLFVLVNLNKSSHKYFYKFDYLSSNITACFTQNWQPLESKLSASFY